MANKKTARQRVSDKKVVAKVPAKDFAVDYKDPTTLRRYLTDRGRIRSRRVTGLSPQQQRQVATAIRNAREMALIPYSSERGSSAR